MSVNMTDCSSKGWTEVPYDQIPKDTIMLLVLILTFVISLDKWTAYTQRKKRLNTVPYLTVLGQIISIYRHTKAVYGNIQDRIQAFFMQ